MKSISNVYKIGSGPSSSHTMGPQNACLKFIEMYPDAKEIKCELYGSLALTGKGHLTDYIIEKTFAPKKVEIIFLMTKTLPKHENGMKLIATLEDNEVIEWHIYSIGGGDIEIDELPSDDLNDQLYTLSTMNSIQDYCKENKLSLLNFVLKTEPELLSYMKEVWDVMLSAIDSGLENSGVLPGPLKVKRRAGILNDGENYDRELILSSYAYAVSEQNASGGIIVTAPTCGACGVLPSVLKFYQEEYNLENDKIYEALIIAGLFGNIVKTNATVSGAEAGCQTEVGTATSMAAAAIVYIKGGTNEQIEAAAEIGLEHQLGLTCDPILGYVQIPCIQRNAIGGSKARLAAKLALKNSELSVVDFDTIVKVMYETGKDMASSYRETSTGGLAKFYKMKAELEK